MCLKTGIYILPLPTPSPWGGGASPLPAAVLGIAAGMLLVCRRAWRSGLGLQPAQLLGGGSRGKWVLLPELQRENHSLRKALLKCISDKQSEQNLHFLCKCLRKVGDCFLLGLQMDTI